MRTTVRVALMLILLCALAPALAQTIVSGSVQGTVFDQKGAVLPGATVIASSDALVARQSTAMTDKRGVYRFPSLPPGVYAFEAQMPGYKTTKQPDVRVRVSQTLKVDLTLPIADVQEEITVTAKDQAPIVSVISNTVSTNLDQSYIKKAPLPRNYYNVIKSVPGVNVDVQASSGSAMLAFGGTGENQNAFTLDGVNVADAGAGQHWLLPSIQWMQEIEVGGLGANAEYGGYTGGVINGVTKSGGNDIHGDLEIYYQPESWSNNNDAKLYDDLQKSGTFKFQDISVSLGGPIAKDKLWFFASGEYSEQVTTPYQALATSDRKIPRFLGKLTWQPNTNNRLMLLGEWDNVTNERRGISYLTQAEASSKQQAPGYTVAMHWESILSSTSFVNVKLTGYDGRDDYLPYNGLDTPGHVDDDSGYAWVNQDIHQYNHRNIVTLDGSWTLYKDGLFGGNDNHTFKFGAAYEKGYSSDVWRRNGGFTYYDYLPDCPGDTLAEQAAAYNEDPSCGRYYIERGWGEYDTRPKYDGLTLYAQDTLRLGNITLNPGLRYGRYDGGWDSGRGNPSVYKTDYIDPRFGIVWDIKGDSSMALKAHWGRYHEKMYTYLYDRERSGAGSIPDQDCYWDGKGYNDCDPLTVVAADVGKVNHPYADEALLTFERSFGKNIVFGIDLINRNFRNIMTLINTNDDYTLYETENPLTGGTIPVWVLNSPATWVLTTDAGAKRDYRSAILRFEKRYADKWQLRSSLVLTDLEGNVLKNNGYAPEYQDRNGLYNANGTMDNSFNKVEFKLSTAFDLPANLQFSTQYTFLTGAYWTPYVRINDISSWGDGYNARTGRNINVLPRGAYQYPDRHLVDLRLAWSKQIKGDVSLTASLELFNALNKTTVLDTYYRVANCYIEDGTCGGIRSNYKQPYLIENPRQLRAGLRLSF